MGAGFSVAPMTLAASLALMLPDTAPAAADFFRALAISLALVNAVNLMPFQPLDGGFCMELVARSLSPAVLYLSVATAVAGLTVAGYFAGGVVLLCFAAAGVVALALRPRIGWSGRPLSSGEAALAFLAFSATLAAHLVGGWLMLGSI
jgi:hypothetical protein